MFYNFWDVDFRYWYHIPDIPSCCGRSWKTNFGITFASAFDIEALVMQSPPRKELPDVLRISWPLRCLGYCNHSDLSESIYKFIKKYIIASWDFKKKFVKKKLDWKVTHPRLPKAILRRLEGEFTKEDPIFTSFIVDRDSPHEEALETVKQFLSL